MAFPWIISHRTDEYSVIRKYYLFRNLYSSPNPWSRKNVDVSFYIKLLQKWKMGPSYLRWPSGNIGIWTQVSHSLESAPSSGQHCILWSRHSKIIILTAGWIILCGTLAFIFINIIEMENIWKTSAFRVQIRNWAAENRDVFIPCGQ